MSPDTYILVLKNRPNEREVFKQFGGLANFGSDQSDLALESLLEVTGDDDLDDLRVFKSAADEVLVDIPVYQASRDNDFGNQIEETFAAYGDQIGFYLANSDRIDVPVVSGNNERTVEYGTHITRQQDLIEAFPTVAHRLIVGRKPLTDHQKRQLRRLASELRPSDRVLFDVIDKGYDEERIVPNIRFLAETFDSQNRAVLNLLNAFSDNRENLSPQVAAELGLSGFGDFAINIRYPSGGGPTGSVRIRHYNGGSAYVEEFEGSDYTEAAEELTDWDEWQTDHCNYCREASRLNRGSASKWKRIRMGHYIKSVLRSEF